ncbi:hypothetical protein PoB_000392300 [Plakobranchus ocellatus]|uniref:Uncharacterized protein n=1 Tax=Plakobranchus ocellatus TaxID=259542 RepID=A0AAV3Y4C2_9GAST|nr:hypothetical protein PoB_000392300 [Plakobranchus ocellatus]
MFYYLIYDNDLADVRVESTKHTHLLLEPYAWNKCRRVQLRVCPSIFRCLFNWVHREGRLRDLHPVVRWFNISDMRTRGGTCE